MAVALKGGAALERTLYEYARKTNRRDTLRVGFLEGATYPSGESVPEVAAYNEFGTSRTPARPIMRPAIAEKSDEWGAKFAAIMQANNLDTVRSLQVMGHVIVGDIQDSIRKVTTPPLAASTVKRKGFDKPLIDTSHMINSVSFEVAQRGGTLVGAVRKLFSR